jgi:hypothetical protein
MGEPWEMNMTGKVDMALVYWLSYQTCSGVDNVWVLLLQFQPSLRRDQGTITY